VENARATLEGAKTAAGRAEEHRRQVEAAEARVTAARTALTAAQAKARRADELVTALRAAPSLALREALEQLNQAAAPAHLRLDGDGVTVTIDGRPWWLASQGRLRFADARLRSAIRSKLVGLPWLTIFVDQAQDWSGEWDVTGPAILAWTVEGPLRVEGSA